MNNNPVKQSPDDVSRTTVTSGSTRDFLAVAVLFLGNGLIVGTFGGSLPGLRSRLDLGPGQIVGVLVAAGIFAVASMNLSGPLSDRFGARLPEPGRRQHDGGCRRGDGPRAELPGARARGGAASASATGRWTSP